MLFSARIYFAVQKISHQVLGTNTTEHDERVERKGFLTTILRVDPAHVGSKEAQKVFLLAVEQRYGLKAAKVKFEPASGEVCVQVTADARSRFATKHKGEWQAARGKGRVREAAEANATSSGGKKGPSSGGKGLASSSTSSGKGKG